MSATSQGPAHERPKPEILVHTDDALAYDGLRRPRMTVKHNAMEYANDMVHSQGMESHRAMFGRAYAGKYRHDNTKHTRPPQMQ